MGSALDFQYLTVCTATLPGLCLAAADISATFDARPASHAATHSELEAKTFCPGKTDSIR